MGELGLSGDSVAVEVDGDVLEGFEGAYDALDADSGGVLEVARRRSSAARPPTGPPARSCYGLSPDAPRSDAHHRTCTRSAPPWPPRRS